MEHPKNRVMIGEILVFIQAWSKTADMVGAQFPQVAS